MGYPILLSQGWSRLADNVDNALARLRRHSLAGEPGLYAELVTLTHSLETPAVRRGGELSAENITLIRNRIVMIMAIAASLHQDGCPALQLPKKE